MDERGGKERERERARESESEREAGSNGCHDGMGMAAPKKFDKREMISLKYGGQ